MGFGSFRVIMPAMTEKLKRRLTTVLCADVEGYSRLMEADEAGTLATLRRYRDAMTALVERHDGRIVNNWATPSSPNSPAWSRPSSARSRPSENSQVRTRICRRRSACAFASGSTWAT